MDQIFSFRMVVEKLLAKGKKLYAAFMIYKNLMTIVDWLAVTAILAYEWQLLYSVRNVVNM